ncbi:MAG: dolichyl-phosphate beta-glucosyltransferase [Pyrinomonadaceae bacterium]
MPQPVSVVIPAYNEGARLGESVATVLAYLAESSPQSELIVVDDGSSDNTVELARNAIRNSRVKAQVISLGENRGKGCAVRTGLLAAKHNLALFSDADLSTPITELPKLIEPIEAGKVDVAFGSRALDRNLIGRHQPWGREQGGRVMNMIIRLATRLPYWDTQCGFKAFNMQFCRPLIAAAKIDRFGFDVELLYLAKLAGLSLAEIPVRWDHADGSKLSVFRDTRRTLWEIAAIKKHQRQGDYRVALEATRELSVENSPRREPKAGSSSAASAVN